MFRTFRSVAFELLGILREMFFLPEPPIPVFERDLVSAYRKEFPDFPLSAAFVAYAYSEGFAREFRAYKFDGERERFRRFVPGVSALAETVLRRYPHAVATFPPSSRISDFSRGYACAGTFFREFRKRSGMPEVRAFRFVRKERKQSSLSLAERFGNVRGNFEVLPSAVPNLRGKTVVLFDDVVSSGATAAECARLLLSTGCREVV